MSLPHRAVTVAGLLLGLPVVLALWVLTPTAMADPADPEPSPAPGPAELVAPDPSPSAEDLGDLPSEGDGGGGGWFDNWFGGLFGGGWFDLPGTISDAIMDFIAELIESAAEPFLGLLGETLLATPAMSTHPVLVEMWTTSWGLALGSYVLLVMAGGLTLMGYETVQTRYAVKQIAPRIVLGLVAASLSLLVMGHAIDLSNALSAAILGSDAEGLGEGLARMLLGDTLGGGNPVHLLVLALVLLVLVAGVLVGYLVRVAVIALLAVSGPLALACHGLPQTEGVAKLWWRALAGALVIQVAQSTTLAVGLRLFFAPGNSLLVPAGPGELGTLLAGLCMFWVLWKIPGWATQVILRGTPATVPHAPAPVRMLRGAALAMLLHRYLPARPTPTRPPPATTGRHLPPPSAGGRSRPPTNPPGPGAPPTPKPVKPAPSLVPSARTSAPPASAGSAVSRAAPPPKSSAGPPAVPTSFRPPVPEPPRTTPARRATAPVDHAAPLFRAPETGPAPPYSSERKKS
ncbi:hypothetical protein [Streptomyces profundus]|uniref:hypothetical protein n=1 Tax=Streptomyces profundus TaxID=2867410 RepID=UPI001D164425|nr:hypothetical protein [Streptomyces sp. MA3_2.13]